MEDSAFKHFKDFNPRSRVGSDVVGTYVRGWIADFNPRSRVGSDIQEAEIFYSLIISIHAPVWGATNLGKNAYGSSPISIHAPVWGATYFVQSVNSILNISIHAPVWGATAKCYEIRSAYLHRFHKI